MEFSDRFQIIQTLGGQKQRKFGRVYLVEKRENKACGVLKALNKSEVQESLCERLRTEALCSFDHPALPSVWDFEETESEILLVRSYIEGTSLDQHWNGLSKRERHPFLVDMIEQLVPIFDILSLQGWVHCDIKPSNLLVDTQGKIHLIDFGMATPVHTQEQRKMLFPLGYAAPELLLNHLDLIDQRTDLFALGILIWRLYSGKLPLAHPNPSIFTNLQLTHPLPEDSGVPKRIQKILAKMSAKHPFKLPPNRMPSDEVKQALQEGMNARYSNLNDVLTDFKAAAPKSFYQRISFR